MTSSSSAENIPLGTDVNGYRLDAQLGEGGMAAVYRATQISLNRPVAIKILNSRFSERADFVTRFERESEALGQLQHPNIVSVIDRGAFDNHYYFVMELVDGSDLDELLAEYEFDPPQMAQIINEVGKGVSYVHQLGIVHRDMKPANILIGKSGAIKVSDFGIAQIARGTQAGRPITGEGASMGTGVYMAPEQMADAKNVDYKADLYALGATFYKLITRRLPMGKFPKPSEVRDDLASEVDEIVLRALDPDPAKRPDSVREFCRDLIVALQKPKSAAKSSALKPPTAAAPGAGGSVAFNQLHAAPGARKKKKGKRKKAAAAPLSPWTKRALAGAVLYVALAGAGAYALMAQIGSTSLDDAGRARVSAAIDALRDYRSVAIVPTPPPADASSQAPPEEGGGDMAAATGSLPGQSPLDGGGVALPDNGDAPPATPEPPKHLTSLDSMVSVRSGMTSLGDNSLPFALAERRENVSYFFIDRFEVSNADYALFVEATGASPPDHWEGDAPPSGAEREPVHGVSREEAQAFAEWVGKRLPYEEEWERAASNQAAGRRSAFPWGDEPGNRANIRTARYDYVDSTTRDATSAGVLHLGGNVAEWTLSDLSGEELAEVSGGPRALAAGGAPSPPEPGRAWAVIRGAGAVDIDAEPLPDEQATLAVKRSYADPSARLAGVGFRCVRGTAIAR